MIKASIDVTKIDKSKLYEGKKGKYLNIVLIETPSSEYGDFMIVQDVSKEEREAGEKGAILGNAKKFGGERRTGNRPTRTTRHQEDSDDIPF